MPLAKRRLSLRANKEVLLTAGALQSPQLLMLSGIGPREHLREQGIPVLHDLPGVGQNLQDHLQLRLLFKVKKPITINDDLKSNWRKFLMGWDWVPASFRAKRTDSMAQRTSVSCDK